MCFLVQDEAEPGCVGQSCLSESKDEGITADAESGAVGQSSAHSDVSSPIGEYAKIRNQSWPSEYRHHS